MVFSVANKMMENNSTIIGIASLSIIPESISLKISPTMMDALETFLNEQTKAQLSSSLAKIGLSIPVLSNREAATIISYIADPQTFPDFYNSCKNDCISFDLPETTGETLRQQYEKTAISLDEFDILIEKSMPLSER